MINDQALLHGRWRHCKAEAVMLGQASYMLTPDVVGFKLTGSLPEVVRRHRPRSYRDADVTGTA